MVCQFVFAHTLVFPMNSLQFIIITIPFYLEVVHAATIQAHGNKKQDLYDYCLKGRHHKSSPEPEPDLHDLCGPWKSRACCTSNVTKRIHDLNLYAGINYNQCKPLSESCKEYFIKDLCFYECSPNIGPWVEKVDNSSVRKERYKDVPLCKSDCDDWFDACKNDFVCSRNWVVHGTNCSANQSYCTTIGNMYESAQSFCEEVWDHSWEYSLDEQMCMKLSFEHSQGNPNDKVTYTTILCEMITRSCVAEVDPIFILTIVIYLIIFTIVLLKIKRARERAIPPRKPRKRTPKMISLPGN